MAAIKEEEEDDVKCCCCCCCRMVVDCNNTLCVEKKLTDPPMKVAQRHPAAMAASNVDDKRVERSILVVPVAGVERKNDTMHPKIDPMDPITNGIDTR